MKKIGIIGSGPVAQALGNGFLRFGYEVMLSSREEGKLAAWEASGGEKAHSGSFKEAAGFGDMLLLCVKGTAAAEALEEAGPENFKGKTVIDTTNPIADAPPTDGVLHYFTTLEESLMERLQHQFPEGRFVKAFNSVGNAFMVQPQFAGGQPTMFICGNEEGAKEEASEILRQFGWEVCDMGKAAGARAIEPLCILWCIPGMLRNEWSHAFKLLKA